MPRRILLFLFSAMALAIVLALMAMVFVAQYLDANDFKQDLARGLSELTGRNVTIGGRLQLDFRPWLALTAQDVSLGPAPGFGPEPMLRVQKVSLSIQPLPLLHQILVADRLALRGLDLNLAVSPDGRTNWGDLPGNLARAMESGPVDVQEAGLFKGLRTHLTGRMDIQSVVLEEARITYQDQGLNQTVSLGGFNLRTGDIRPGQPVAVQVNATLNQPGLKWPLAARAEAVLDGVWNSTPALTVSRLDLHTLTPLVPGDFGPARLSLRPEMKPGSDTLWMHNVTAQALGITASGEACLTGALTRPSINATFQVAEFAPQNLFKALAPNSTLAQASQNFATARLSGRVQASNASLALDGLQLGLDHLNLEGSASLDNFRHPRIAFDLRCPALDLDALAAKASPAKERGRHEAPTAFWRELVGSGRLTATELTAGGIKARDVVLSAQANTGTMVLKVEQAKVLGGKLKAQVNADLPGSRKGLEKQMLARLSLDLEGAEATAAQEALALPRSLTGRLDLSARLSAMGAEAADLPRAANGTVVLKSQRGLLTLGAKTDKSPAAPGRPPLAFAQAQARISLSPLPASPQTGKPGTDSEPMRTRLGLDLSATGEMHDGRPQYQWSSSVQGDVEYIPRDLSLVLRGATVSAALEDGFLPPGVRQASLSAQADFDPIRGAITLRKADLKALGLDLEAEGSAQGLWTPAWSGKGSLRLPRANPRDLLPLLNATQPETSDLRTLRQFSAQADVALTPDGASFSNVSGTLDDTHFKGEVGLTGYEHPGVSFNLEADTLDLDRYRPSKPKEEEQAKPPKAEPEPVKETPLQLDRLRNLDLDGSLSLNRFKYRDLLWTQLTARMKARKGQFEFAPVQAAFYGGRYECAFRGEVTAFLLKAGLNIHINAFQAGPFMEAMSDRDYVRGTTDMYYDLESIGATDMDILRNLIGKAGFTITKGSYKFFGYDQPPPTPQSPAGDIGTMPNSPPSEQRTVFDKVRANFKVDQGSFVNDDFSLTGLLVSGEGRGKFSLPADSINYTLNMNLMHATNMPVRLSGKLSDPDVSVPKGELLVDTVKDVLDIPLKPLRFLRDIFLPNKKVLKSSPLDQSSPAP